MRKELLLILIAIFSVLTLGGCVKQPKSEMDSLQSVVDKLNAKTGTSFGTGTVFEKCEIDKKDSVFIYYLQVTDDHLNDVSPEEFKKALADSLGTNNQKLLSLLSRNAYSLKYVYKMGDKELSVTFSPNDLSQSVNK